MTGLIVTLLVICGSVLAIGLFALVLLSLVVSTAVGGLARASITPVELDESGEDWKCASTHHDWADGHGFEWLDSFAFVAKGNQPAVILAWRRPATGTYFLLVDSFTPDQFGDFLSRVSEVEVAEQVLSDYNLLFFLEDGTFIGAYSEQNLFSNRPLEAGGLPEAQRQAIVLTKLEGLSVAESAQRRGASESAINAATSGA